MCALARYFICFKVVLDFQLYWVEDTEQIEFCNHEELKRTRCKKIVETRRQCKERFSMNSLFVSNFISLTLFLVIYTEIA